jgi:hypothetical protein
MLGDPLTKLVVGVSLVASLFCASSSLPIIEKAWHVSPARNPMSSDLYSVAEWRNVRRVRCGMSEERAIHVLGVRWLQHAQHFVNAIVYTKGPDGVEYEVALKREGGHITDVSFKRVVA